MSEAKYYITHKGMISLCFSKIELWPRYVSKRPKDCHAPIYKVILLSSLLKLRWQNIFMLYAVCCICENKRQKTPQDRFFKQKTAENKLSNNI
jgi:hypothetical protein